MNRDWNNLFLEKVKKNKQIARVLFVLAAILFLIFACINIYNYVQTASSEEIIHWIIVYVALIILGILGAKFPALKHFVDSALVASIRFSFWYFIFFIPFLPFRYLSEMVPHLPAWLEALIFILWGICFVVFIWALILGKNRIRLFTWLRKKVGILAPLAYSFDLLVIGIYFFSSLTFVLVDSGILHWVVPIGQNITPGTIANFYFWHFFDAVPVFKITDTLLWKEPLTYDNGWVGSLLLLFKIVVISPIIGAFVWYWQFIGQESKDEGTQI